MIPQTPQHVVDPDIAKIAWNRPIPGQSWATQPPKSTPWQQPPMFVTMPEAMNWLMNTITEPVHMKELLGIMDSGMSIEAIARTFLFTGFTQGKWTPTLMKLLYKPVMLSLIAIAKRAKLDHVPVAHPELIQDYHLNNLKKSMVQKKAKDSGDLTGVTKSEDMQPQAPSPSAPVAPPQPSNNGFMSRNQ